MSSPDCSSVGPSESVDTFKRDLNTDNKTCNTDNIVMDNIVNETNDADKALDRLSDCIALYNCDENNSSSENTRKNAIIDDSGLICSSEDVQVPVLNFNNENKKSESSLEISFKTIIADTDNEILNTESSLAKNLSNVDENCWKEIGRKQEISDVSELTSAIFVKDHQRNDDKSELESNIIRTNILEYDNQSAGNTNIEDKFNKSDDVSQFVIESPLTIERTSSDVDDDQKHNTNDMITNRKEGQNFERANSPGIEKEHDQCFVEPKIVALVETGTVLENNILERNKNRRMAIERIPVVDQKSVLIKSGEVDVALENARLEDHRSSNQYSVDVVKDVVVKDSQPEDSPVNVEWLSKDISTVFNSGDCEKSKSIDVQENLNVLIAPNVSETKNSAERRREELAEKSTASSDKQSEGDVNNEGRPRSRRVSRGGTPKKDSKEIPGDRSSRRYRSSDKYRSRERSRSRKRSRSRDQSRSRQAENYRRRRNSRSRSNERRARDTSKQRKSSYDRVDRDTKRRRSRSPSDSEYSRRNQSWSQRRTTDHRDEKVFDLREKISKTPVKGNGTEVYDENRKSIRSDADVSLEYSRRGSGRGEETNTVRSLPLSKEATHQDNVRDVKDMEGARGDFKWRGNRDEVPINSERNISRQFEYRRSAGNRERGETDRRQDRRGRDGEQSVDNRDRPRSDKNLEDIVGESLARIRRCGVDGSVEKGGTNNTPISNDNSSKDDLRANGNRAANNVDDTNSAIHVVSSGRQRNHEIEIIMGDNERMDDKATAGPINQSVVVNIHEPPPNAVNIHEPPPNFFPGTFAAVNRHALPEGNRFCTPPPGFDQIPGQFTRGVHQQLPHVGVPFEHLVQHHHQLLRPPPSGVLLRGPPSDGCLERPGAEFRLTVPPTSGQQQPIRMEWRVVNPQEMMTLHRFPAPQFFAPGSIHNGAGGQSLIRTGMGPNDLIPVSLQPQVMTLQPGHQFTPTSMGTIVRLDGSMQHVVSSADGGQMVQLGLLMNRPPLMSVGSHLSSHLTHMQPPMHQNISAIPLPTRAMMYLNPSDTLNLSSHSNPSPGLNPTLAPMMHSVQPSSGTSYPIQVGDAHGRQGPPQALRNDSIPPPPPTSSLSKPHSYWSISPVEMSESEEEEEADNLSDEDHEEPVTIYRNDSAADFAANVSSKQWHGVSASSSHTGVADGGGSATTAREPIQSTRPKDIDTRTYNVHARNKHASDSLSSDNSDVEESSIGGSVEFGRKAPPSDLNLNRGGVTMRPSSESYAKTTSSATSTSFAQAAAQPPRFTSAGFKSVITIESNERISIDDSQSSVDSVEIIRPPVPRQPTSAKPLDSRVTVDNSLSSEDSDNAVSGNATLGASSNLSLPSLTINPLWTLLGKHQTSATDAAEVTRVPPTVDADIVTALPKTKDAEKKLSKDSGKTKKSKEIMDRVVEEVKTALKPYYAKLSITKEEYKDIMRRAVPKICRSTKGSDVLPAKIREFIDQYVAKVTHRSGTKKLRESAARTGAGHSGKSPHRSSK